MVEPGGGIYTTTTPTVQRPSEIPGHHNKKDTRRQDTSLSRTQTRHVNGGLGVDVGRLLKCINGDQSTIRNETKQQDDEGTMERHVNMGRPMGISTPGSTESECRNNSNGCNTQPHRRHQLPDGRAVPIRRGTPEKLGPIGAAKEFSN